jgi:thiamine-monophosphate kinase
MIPEDDLIARHFAPIAGPGAFGLKDDAAILSPPAGHDLVLTKDMLVAGVHFFADDPPASIARKALRVNLSDLAAKGAEPAGFLLGLGLTDAIDDGWLAAFAAGLADDARAYALPLLGGDTVRSPGAVTLSVTALGYAPSGRMVRRTAARPGLLLAVTGTIGDAALGLKIRLDPQTPWALSLDDAARGHLLERYLHPQPRNALAGVIRAHAVAAMDVSDGLAGDALKLARAAIEPGQPASPIMRLADIPLSPAARTALQADPGLIETIATGGDDYEVLMAVEPASLPALQRETAALGCPVSLIGELMEPDQPPRWIGSDGEPVRFGRLRFEHGASA